MDPTITNAIPQQVLEATGQDLTGKYMWLFVVGLVALMFKSSIEKLAAALFMFIGNDYKEDDVVYVDGKPGRIIRVGLTKTVFFIYDVVDGKIVSGNKMMPIARKTPTDLAVGFWVHSLPPATAAAAQNDTKAIPRSPNVARRHIRMPAKCGVSFRLENRGACSSFHEKCPRNDRISRSTSTGTGRFRSMLRRLTALLATLAPCLDVDQGAKVLKLQTGRARSTAA